MRKIMGVVLLVAACGGDDEPVPTCQQSLTHFYGAGCVYRDLQSGQDIPRDTAIANCLNAASMIPNDRCRAAFDDYLICNASVPEPSSTNADCDCSAAIMDIATCD